MRTIHPKKRRFLRAHTHTHIHTYIYIYTHTHTQGDADEEVLAASPSRERRSRSPELKSEDDREQKHEHARLTTVEGDEVDNIDGEHTAVFVEGAEEGDAKGTPLKKTSTQATISPPPTPSLPPASSKEFCLTHSTRTYWAGLPCRKFVNPETDELLGLRLGAIYWRAEDKLIQDQTFWSTHHTPHTTPRTHHICVCLREKTSEPHCATTLLANC